MVSLSPKEQDLLIRFDQKEEFRPLFLRRVRGLKWFDHLNQRGCFDPSSVPRPEPTGEEGYVRIVAWPITDYLVKTAPELAQESNREYAKKFLHVLVSATEQAKENGFGNYRIWLQFAQVIRHIPAEAIDVANLKIVDYWLDDAYDTLLVAEEIGDGWLPELLDSGGAKKQSLATELIRFLYNVRLKAQTVGDFDMNEAALRVDRDSIRRITDEIAFRAGRELGTSCLEVFREQLAVALSGEGSDLWSEFWHPAIEDHQQNEHCDEAMNVLVRAYRDALLGYLTESPENAREYVSCMFSDEYQTVRRIAIHAVTKNFLVCRNLLKVILSEEYFTANYRHEVWTLLNGHFKEFGGGERTKLKDIVLRITRTDQDGKLEDSATAFERATWLAAIRSFGSQEEDFYQEQVALAGAEPENPSFSSFRTSGPVVREFPIPLEKLAGMPVQQIVDLFCERGSDTSTRVGQDSEGFSRALREAVKTSPLKFHSQLSEFLGCKLTFVRQIIEAYRELWTQHEELPWGEVWPNVLRFCLNLISREEFWGEVDENPISLDSADRYETLQSIAILIEDGTKSDSAAFDAENLPVAEEVLDILLQRESGEDYEEGSDAVTFAINSPRGRTLLALINLTLRTCRLADREENDHQSVWERFAPIYDSEFQRAATENEYEFITLIAKLLPNFLYMSSTWTLKNLSRIFDQKNEATWRCAMQGYSRVKPIYGRVFEFLKREGHLTAALDDVQLDDQVRKGVIRNICAAYVSDIESLSRKDSLIGEIVARGEFGELSRIIWVIWTMRESENADFPSKVLMLWSEILNRLDFSLPEHRRLASKLCMLAVFLEQSR